MHRLGPAHTAATALVLLLSGCAAAMPCPAGRVCGASTWVPVGGSVVEGTMVVAAASEAAGAEGPQTEQLALGGRPVLLRFDLTGIEGRGTVERAVLALAPHASWRTGGGPAHVFARAIVSRWSRASVAAVGAPSMDPSPAGEAVVPGDRRTPVRIDVTSALQAWQAAGTPFEGLALAADGDGVVVDGVGAANPADRPRLEVVLR